jgi:putative membrane protein
MEKKDMWSKAALPLVALTIAASMQGNVRAQTLSAKDRAWMDKAAMAGAAEVQAGNLAATKASSPAIKSFASQMVTDHGKAGDELKTIAAGKNITLPSAPDKKHQEELAKLEKLSGEKFDKEYVKSAGVKDHRDAENHFKDGAKNLKDPDVKAFAAKTLPTIQHHREMAKALR